MSHYTVLVIGSDPEGLLEPYSEHLEMEPYKERMSDEDVARMREFYEKKDERKLSDEELLDHMHDWNGTEGGIDDEGMYYLSTYNPDSKWDWYSLGGRWIGSFKLKVNAEGILGSPGLMTKVPSSGVDQAKKGDIDWEGMRAEAIEKLKKEWKLIQSATPEKFSEYFGPFSSQEVLQKKFKTEEEYLNSYEGFSTYAVLDDEGWHEPGKMGWWGVSHAEEGEEDKFREGFYERFIKNLPDDTLLSVYDCHI